MDEWDSLFKEEGVVPGTASSTQASASDSTTAAPPSKRGRGRPHGSFGGGNFWRNAGQVGGASDVGVSTPQPSSIEYARACLQSKIQEKKRDSGEHQKDSHALVGFGPQSSLGILGSSLQLKTYEAVKLASEKGIDGSLVTDDFVDLHASGDQLAMSGRAKATFLKDTSHPERRLASTASAIIQLCGYFWSVFLTMLCSFGNRSGHDVTTETGEQRPFRLVLSAFKLRYDETPTKVRVVDADAISMDSKAGHSTDPNFLSSASLQAKILQVELSMGVLFEDGQGKYCWTRTILPTSLYAVDSTSGENIHWCLKDCLAVIPDFMRTSQKFKLSIRHSCTDRAPANFKAERLLGRDYHWMTSIHTPCDVHRLATATQVAMTSVEFDVGGILSVGLAMQDLGAASALQQVLAKVLARSLVVYHTQPPKDPAIATYRQELFQLFLPIEGVQKARAWRNQKRRFIIAWFLNGQLWDKSEVSHYCPWGCCCSPEETLRLVSTYLVWAIAPFKCPKFVRSKWTRYDESVDFLGLLGGLHGLLQPTLSEMWGSPHTRVPIATMTTQDHQQQELGWDELFHQEASDRQSKGTHDDLPDSPDVAKTKDHYSLPNPAHMAPTGQADDHGADQKTGQTVDGVEQLVETATAMTWAEFNHIQKSKAKEWICTEPYPRLVVIKEIISILMPIMYHFLALAGIKWEKKQEYVASQGHQRSYPVLEACKNDKVHHAMNQLHRMFWSRIPAVLENQVSPRLRALRFRVISCALCSLHVLLCIPRQSCPYSIFRILLGEAHKVLETPQCMQDQFARLILSRYESRLHLR